MSSDVPLHWMRPAPDATIVRVMTTIYSRVALTGFLMCHARFMRRSCAVSNGCGQRYSVRFVSQSSYIGRKEIYVTFRRFTEYLPIGFKRGATQHASIHCDRLKSRLAVLERVL